MEDNDRCRRAMKVSYKSRMEAERILMVDPYGPCTLLYNLPVVIRLIFKRKLLSLFPLYRQGHGNTGGTNIMPKVIHLVRDRAVIQPGKPGLQIQLC